MTLKKPAIGDHVKIFHLVESKRKLKSIIIEDSTEFNMINISRR